MSASGPKGALASSENLFFAEIMLRLVYADQVGKLWRPARRSAGEALANNFQNKSQPETNSEI